MALQAWIGRTSGQLDADSPLDITLFNGIDDDLIHLRQVVYGDGAGGFRTPIDGHDHSVNGANSPPLAADSVTGVQVADEAIGGNKIYSNTTYGSTSVAAVGGTWVPTEVVVGTTAFLASGAGGATSQIDMNSNWRNWQTSVVGSITTLQSGLMVGDTTFRVINNNDTVSANIEILSLTDT